MNTKVLLNKFKLRLPKPKSNEWLIIGFILFLLTFVIFIGSRLIIGLRPEIQEILGLAIPSAVPAILITLAGYFGNKVFTLVSIAGLIVANIVMLLISMDDGVRHWADLVGFSSFLVITGWSMVIGSIAQVAVVLIAVVLKRKSKDQEKHTEPVEIESTKSE